MTVVGSIWGAIVVVSFCKHKDVVPTTERVLEDGSRTEIYVRVMSGGLVCGRTIEVPYTEGANIGNLLVHGLMGSVGKKNVGQYCITHGGFGAETAIAVDPNVWWVDKMME